MPRLDPRIGVLLEVLDHAFDHRSWHGTTLLGALRGLSLREALWRPSPARHSIWELILHAAYWKYVVTRRLTGGGRGSFPREGSDWPHLPQPANGVAWRRDVGLLQDQHAHLKRAIIALPPSRLGARKGSKWTVSQHIHGVAAHDLYHTGQIQLLKRLCRERRTR